MPPFTKATYPGAIRLSTTPVLERPCHITPFWMHVALQNVKDIHMKPSAMPSTACLLELMVNIVHLCYANDGGQRQQCISRLSRFWNITGR